MNGSLATGADTPTQGQFSVVIPVWNGRRTILRAIDGALSQSHPPTEVIVVDDGSTDGTGALVHDRFPCVRVLRQTNTGPGPARRRGIVAARCAWVAFLDADDMWTPRHLAELLELRSRFPRAKLVSTSHLEVPVGQSPPAPSVNPRVRREEIDYFARAAKDVGIVWSSSAAAEREVLISADCFIEDGLGEDLAAWARLALHHPVAISDLVTAYYLRRSDSLMAQSPAQPAAEFSPTSSMKVVLHALERGGHAAPIDSLLAYLDGRITSGWKRLLISGQRQVARRRVSRLRNPHSPRTLGLRLAATAPGWFGPSLYKMVLTIRQVRVSDSRRR